MCCPLTTKTRDGLRIGKRAATGSLNFRCVSEPGAGVEHYAVRTSAPPAITGPLGRYAPSPSVPSRSFGRGQCAEDASLSLFAHSATGGETGGRDAGDTAPEGVDPQAWIRLR